MRYLAERCFTWLCGLCLLAACTQESGTDGLPTTGSGFLLSLSELSIQSDGPTNTRTAPAELEKPVAANFQVTILPEGSTQPLYSGAFTSEPIQATPGNYTLTAHCGSNPILAWDAPYYEGSTEATVNDRGYTPVTIPCRVANALLSVRFSNPSLFEQLYSDYGVTVQNGDYSLRITPDNSSLSAYFPAGNKPVISFSATLLSNGSQVSFSLDQDLTDILPLQAGQHATLTLSASNAAFTIEKIEVVDTTIDATVPDSWLPCPKVNGFDAISYVETNDAPSGAEISYSASRPIQAMELTFHFEDPQYANMNNKTFVLNALTEEERTQLANIGLTTLPQFGVDKEGTFNFSPLIGTLQTNAGTTTVNTISLRVKANDRWSDEKTAAAKYQVTVEKPEFGVIIYPGDIWTKEFTITPIANSDVRKGNFDVISNNLVYQYSTDGTQWSNVNNSTLLQNNMSPGQQVQVRALYRQAVSSDVKVFNMCEQIPMPYGDMELWTDKTQTLYLGSKAVWPFITKVNVTAHSPNNNIWSCVNQKTFEGSPNVKSTYNLNPSTYRVDGRSGYAAALRTVGWDNDAGNASLTPIYHISAGKIFIGTYSFTHKKGPEVYNYGMEYVSRPTHITAWYTYSPYNSDSFKAWVVLENRDDANDIKRIGYGELSNGNSVSSFTQLTIPIVYDEQYKQYKVTHAYVVFSSSANCSDDEDTETNNLKGMVSTGDYHNGSVFIIDDIAFRYDK